uniref:Putative effector protein n=1 Tax=Heterodera avenae TaxID=34510 RepID=A0A2L0VDN4_HETAV|nr:putative effector protein [Heterodera avenae]
MLLNFLLVISLFVFSTSGVCASQCPFGWTHLAYGQKCVKAFPALTDWSNGELTCAYQGGHHISVKDYYENYYLAELAKTLPGGQVWLGAFRAGTSYYSWSDRTPFGYFVRWRGNVTPSRNGLGCVKLDGVSGEWFQSCCRKSAATICQKQASGTGTFRLR